MAPKLSVPKGFDSNTVPEGAGFKGANAGESNNAHLTNPSDTSNAPRSALLQRLQAELAKNKAVAKSAAASTATDSLGFNFGGDTSFLDDVDEAQAAKVSAENARLQQAATAQKLFERNEARRQNEPSADQINTERLASRSPKDRVAGMVKDLSHVNSMEFGENGEGGKEGKGKVDLAATRNNLLMNFPELGELVGPKGETITGVKATEDAIIIDYKMGGENLKLKIHPDGKITG